MCFVLGSKTETPEKELVLPFECLARNVLLRAAMGLWQPWASGAPTALACVVALVGCREATAIELRISTDLKCEDVRVVTTSIGSGSLENYEARPPSAVTTRCDETTGHIGSLVLLPSDDDRAEVAVRIVTARNSKAPEECVARATAECIIAERVVRFVPHRTLTLPVRMQNVCAGVVCGPRATCSASGRCVSSILQVPTHCPLDGCEADLPQNGASVGGIEDAGAPTPGLRDAGRPLTVEAGVDIDDAGTVQHSNNGNGNGNVPTPVDAGTVDDDAAAEVDAGNAGSGPGNGNGKKPKKPKKNSSDAVD